MSNLGRLTLAALGVVYGDIGTSVLYAMKEIFASGHVPLTSDNIFGVLSMLVWTLTLIVSLKYVSLVLKADNRGEGGLVAMLALASESVGDRPGLKQFLFLSVFLVPASFTAMESSRQQSQSCRLLKVWH